MTYSIHPKIHRLQHEIHTLERHLTNARQRIGMTNPSILQNYKEMIQTRKDLIDMLQARHEKMASQRMINIWFTRKPEMVFVLPATPANTLGAKRAHDAPFFYGCIFLMIFSTP